MKVLLDKVYLLSVEESGDDFFSPAGVVVRTEKNQFFIYCASANHNLYRTVLYKHPWERLLDGEVRMRGMGFRLTDLSFEMAQRGWTSVDDVPAMLHHLHRSNPKQYYFLDRLIRANS